VDALEQEIQAKKRKRIFDSDARLDVSEPVNDIETLAS
jgi:hypothetical protein